MGKRPKKKIFLFLVEGVSDRNALEVPFGQLLEDIDPDIWNLPCSCRMTEALAVI